jgi:hypothetical protein
VIAEKLCTELISRAGEGQGRGEDGEAISHPPMRQPQAFWVKALPEMAADTQSDSHGPHRNGVMHVVYEPEPDPKGGGRAQARDLTGISPSDEGAQVGAPALYVVLVGCGRVVRCEFKHLGRGGLSLLFTAEVGIAGGESDYSTAFQIALQRNPGLAKRYGEVV